MLKDYVVVDLEMTGLKAKTDRILEIGSVKVTDGMETAVFHCMVNPHMEIPPEITDLTGITNEMAAQGLEAAEAVREFAAFSRSLPLIGHNILFDYSFLKQAAVNHGIPFEKECLDTLKLARKYLPEAEKKTLDYLCGLLGIRQEEVMAFGDNDNDIGMMLAAGISYAVETAVPKVKEAAGRICPGWAEKGVYQAARINIETETAFEINKLSDLLLQEVTGDGSDRD